MSPDPGSGLSTRRLYLAGFLAPLVFLSSVLIGGARRAGYSHLADPVSALGMSGAADGSAIDAAWAATGLLIVTMSGALWFDREGPGRWAAAALALAGAASTAIALWFPMDPPGLAASFAQQGHNVLVAFAALAFAAAMLVSARSAAAGRTYRRFTIVALTAMVAGGAGAALASAFGWELVGGFERVTQVGYHGWILLTAATGLVRRWQNPTAAR